MGLSIVLILLAVQNSVMKPCQSTGRLRMGVKLRFGQSAIYECHTDRFPLLRRPCFPLLWNLLPFERVGKYKLKELVF